MPHRMPENIARMHHHARQRSAGNVLAAQQQTARIQHQQLQILLRLKAQIRREQLIHLARRGQRAALHLLAHRAAAQLEHRRQRRRLCRADPLAQLHEILSLHHPQRRQRARLPAQARRQLQHIAALEPRAQKNRNQLIVRKARPPLAQQLLARQRLRRQIEQTPRAGRRLGSSPRVSTRRGSPRLLPRSPAADGFRPRGLGLRSARPGGIMLQLIARHHPPHFTPAGAPRQENAKPSDGRASSALRILTKSVSKALGANYLLAKRAARS